MSNRWQRLGLRASFLAVVTLLIAAKSGNASWPWDFRTFYGAAEIVRHGPATKLFDVGFLSPPAVALIFLPLAWLPIKVAFAIWTIVNLLLLVATIGMLQRQQFIAEGDRPLFFALLFTPAYACLLAGQFAFVILFLYSASFVLMRNHEEFLSGLMLGVGCLKFPLVLGFLAIMLLRRRWKFTAGAALGGLFVAAVSLLMVGWRGLLQYPSMLRRAAGGPDVAYTYAMANVRGLMWLLSGREVSAWIIAPVSGLLLVCAAISWKDTETGFSIAVIASMLTAYHIHGYDFTLLLLPIAVTVARVKWDTRSMFAAGATLAIVYGLGVAGLPALFGFLLSALLLVDLWKARRAACKWRATELRIPEPVLH